MMASYRDAAASSGVDVRGRLDQQHFLAFIPRQVLGNKSNTKETNKQINKKQRQKGTNLYFALGVF